MAYPNVSAAEVRNGIAHITVTIKSDARLLELITEAKDWLEARMHSKVDLDAVKALATTPPTWKLIIIYRTRALVLADAYGTSRATNINDITAWQTLADEILNGLIDGSSKLLDASGNLIATGINYAGISSNKAGADEEHKVPAFGYGDDGEGKTDINDGTVYNDPS